MLPFDNKSEMQVIIDMPDGTTLEQTARMAREVARRVALEPEVVNYQIYAGTAGPYNFNGLVRHYFLRQGPDRADIQVNLVAKNERSAQSHDIAKRIREAIQPIGDRYEARLKVAEIPPGPPVIETLVAEVYGPDYLQQIEVARQIRDKFRQTPGVVDVDWMVEDPQTQYQFVVDKEKAALNRTGRPNPATGPERNHRRPGSSAQGEGRCWNCAAIASRRAHQHPGSWRNSPDLSQRHAGAAQRTHPG
jgi:multidrug efflux pump subunit AcrB